MSDSTLTIVLAVAPVLGLLALSGILAFGLALVLPSGRAARRDQR